MGNDNSFERLLRSSRRVQVGGCRADLVLNEVHRDGNIARLTPKAAAVLEVLLYFAGAPVSKERLLAEVWRGEFPTEDVVTHAIGEIRRAFGDDPRSGRFIRTVPKVGYVLVAQVEALGDPEPAVDIDALAPPLASADDETSTSAASVTTPSPTVRGLSRRAAGPLAYAVATLVLLMLGVVVAMAPWRTGQREVHSETAEKVHSAVPVTSLPGKELFPSISPDANLLAFSAENEGGSRVFLQVPGEDRSWRVSQQPADNEYSPVFSPDGRRLAFQRVLGRECHLVVVGILGGGERSFDGCSSPLVLMPLAWTNDGEGLLLPAPAPDGSQRTVLHRLDIASGGMTPLSYAHDTGRSDVQAKPSPDGGWIAFRRGTRPNSDLFVMRPDGSELRRLTELNAAMSSFAWATDAESIVFDSDHSGTAALYEVALGTGRVHPLGVQPALSPDIASRRGELIFVRDRTASQVAEISIDGQLDGKPQYPVRSSRNSGSARYAPDGSRFAFVSDRSGRSGLYLWDGESTTRLVAYADRQIAELRWSADGRELLFVGRGEDSRLFSADLATGAIADITPDGHDVRSAELSPDGRTLVVVGDRTGRWELWAVPRAGGEPRQLSTDGGRAAAFVDAETLIYVAAPDVAWGDTGALRRLDLRTGTTSELGLTVGFWNQSAWQPVEDGVYVLHGTTAAEFGIWRIAWDGGAPELVEPVEMEAVGQYDLSVHAGSRRALITLAPRPESDVYRVVGRVF